MIYAEIAIILLLIAANGIFALSELAIISARRGRLQDRADAGVRGAQAALRLAESSPDFLATVQIGITLIGIVAGVFGGATLGDELALILADAELIGEAAEEISVAIIVLTLTYLSLVIGELVPKRLALRDPERLAITFAPVMERIAAGARPLVVLLSGSTDLVLRLIGAKDSSEPAVTVEDVTALLEQGAQGGVFMSIERDLVERALSLREQTIRTIMTHRSQIVWIDVQDGPEKQRNILEGSSFSRFPVGDGSVDEIVGIVYTSDLVHHLIDGATFDVASMMREPLFIPEHATLIQAVEAIGRSQTSLAIVVDEYGGVEGIVTTRDLLTAVLGGIIDVDENEPGAVEREDGSWLLDGQLPLSMATAVLEVELPASIDASTIGGFIMTRLGRIPETADRLQYGDIRFEVVDMDGHRVDKVLATREVFTEGKNRPTSPKRQEEK